MDLESILMDLFHFIKMVLNGLSGQSIICE